jgi:hypothetical protein
MRSSTLRAEWGSTLKSNRGGDITEPAGANDIRLSVRESLHQLRKLYGRSRVVMTREAVEALSSALDAMHWVEGLPQPNGV